MRDAAPVQENVLKSIIGYFIEFTGTGILKSLVTLLDASAAVDAAAHNASAPHG